MNKNTAIHTLIVTGAFLAAWGAFAVAVHRQDPPDMRGVTRQVHQLNRWSEDLCGYLEHKDPAARKFLEP